MTNKVRDLTNENQNFHDALDTYKKDCEKNGLSSSIEFPEPERRSSAKNEDYKSNETCVNYKTVALIAIP